MKKSLLLVVMGIMLATVACKGKKEEGGTGNVGQVQTPHDTAQVEAQYKDLIAKDPKNYEAVVGLANLYYDTGKPELAIESYKKALEINPNDVNVRTDMGSMYRRMGQPDMAIEEFRKSVSINPKHDMSWYNLGVTLYYDKNDHKGAANAWEEMLKVAPNHPNATALKEMISQIRGGNKAAAKK